MELVERWRKVACDFHAVRWCLDTGLLRPDFEPADLVALRRRPNTGAIRGVFSFLLHIYNHANRFDLAETQRWDREHLEAFTGWVTGRQTGFPCQYF